MEDEMNRFKQEISIPNVIPQASRPVIGSHTYNKVSEQLHQQQQQMQHQAYSMINMYTDALHRQARPISQPMLKFIPHQLKIHNPQQQQQQQQIPSMNISSSAPAVYSAPPVKIRKIEIPIAIRPPKVENFIPPPIDKPQILIPPLPVKKAPTVIPYTDSCKISQKKEKEKPRRCIRTAAGESWEDTSLLEWEVADFRIFCGDLGNDVTDDVLTRAFCGFPSFLKAKVVRDKKN
uniref:RRM domain-containing protein n=2 Tax=Strigamia maritima TaxID=126957 RepID=T1IK04_STRMM